MPLRSVFLQILFLALLPACGQAWFAIYDFQNKDLSSFGPSKPNPEGFLFVPKRLLHPPKSLLDRYGSETPVFALDLDGDGKDDFIAFGGPEKNEVALISSDFKRRQTKKYGPSDTRHFYFFGRFSKNGVLYCFDFGIDEDSSDLNLLEFNPKTWRFDDVATFLPAMANQDPQHPNWAYPWDIRDLRVRAEKDEYLILMDLPDEGEEESELEKETFGTPVVYFRGKTSQPDAKFQRATSKLGFRSISSLLSYWQATHEEKSIAVHEEPKN